MEGGEGAIWISPRASEWLETALGRAMRVVMPNSLLGFVSRLWGL